MDLNSSKVHDKFDTAVKRRPFLLSSALLKSLRSVPLLFIMIAITAVPLMAQDSSTASKKISLSEAINMAMGVNVSIKRADASMRDTQSRLRVAGFSTTYGVNTSAAFDRDPMDTNLSTRVTGNVKYTNLIGTQAQLELSPYGFGAERGAVGISLRHPLTQGKGMLSDKSEMVLSARSASLIENRNFYLSKQSTILNVIRAYYDAIESRELVIERQNALTYVEQAAVYARKREEAGLGRGIDVSRAEVQVARARDDLNLQRSAARAAMDSLMVAIGTGVGKDYELTDPVPAGPLPIPPLDEAIKTALKNRSELSIYDQQLDDQQRKLALSKDKLRPALDVVARFNSANQDSGIISGSIIDAGALRVGVEMTIPLDKRIDEEDIGVAERGLNLIKQQRDFRSEQITEEVRRSYRSLEAASASLQIYTQNLNEAKENLRIAERMVEEGEGDNRDVLEAQSSLTRVTSSIVSAKINHYLASVNLKYAMGEDLTTLGSL